MKNDTSRLLIIILSILVCCGLCLFYLYNLQYSLSHTQYSDLPVSAPVEILVDEFSVNHVYAGTLRDIYFMQGHLHARHYLRHTDLLRRIASGNLSSLYGNQHQEDDLLLKMLNFYQNSGSDLADMDSLTLSILMAYSDGISAWADQSLDQQPQFYRRRNTKPLKWQPEDCIAVYRVIHWLQSDIWAEKLLSRKLVPLYGQSRIAPVFPDAEFQLPEDDAGLENFTLYNRLIQLWNNLRKMTGIDGIPVNRATAISPRRSASGLSGIGFIMKNKIPAENGIHICELNTPGYRALGVSIPGLPGIIAGTNGLFAWVLFSDNSRQTSFISQEYHVRNNTLYTTGSNTGISAITLEIENKNQIGRSNHS